MPGDSARSLDIKGFFTKTANNNNNKNIKSVHAYILLLESHNANGNILNNLKFLMQTDL